MIAAWLALIIVAHDDALLVVQSTDIQTWTPQYTVQVCDDAHLLKVELLFPVNPTLPKEFFTAKCP
jgi:hypothetical protein